MKLERRAANAVTTHLLHRRGSSVVAGACGRGARGGGGVAHEAPQQRRRRNDERAADELVLQLRARRRGELRCGVARPRRRHVMPAERQKRTRDAQSSGPRRTRVSSALPDQCAGAARSAFFGALQ